MFMDNTESDLQAASGTTEDVLRGANDLAGGVVTSRLIDDFGRWLYGTVSAQTLESYMGTMRRYCLNKSIAAVNHKRFFAELRQEILANGMSLASIMRHTAAAKKFLVFLNEMYDMPIINLSLVHCKRGPRKNPTYLTKEEVAVIRNVPVRTVLDLRDRALFEFILDTGARVSEALSVDWQNIDFAKGEVTVIGKGSKQRTLFLRESSPWIQQYLEQRQTDAPPLFVTYTKLRRLNRENAGDAIRKLAEKAGLEKRVHPHMLRHTFGTYLMWAGTDPKTVQELLGHADLDMTLRYYVASETERMKDAHKNLGNIIGRSEAPKKQKYLLYK